MEEGCEAMMARRQDTFFKGTVMVTSEMSNIFHVANGGCVTLKKIHHYSPCGGHWYFHLTCLL